MFGSKKEPEASPAFKAAARAFFELTEDEDWAKAAASYREAYNCCGTATQKELGLRADICAFYGIALKNLYSLEEISEKRPPSRDQLNAVVQIKRLWTEMLDIYARVPEEVHHLDREMVKSMRTHWIMPD